MVDPSIKEQNFIEDCEICCNPIDFVIYVDNNEINSFLTDKIDQ